MPRPTTHHSASRRVGIALALACGLATIGIAPPGRAEFSRPPEPSPYEPGEPYEPREPHPSDDPRSYAERDDDWADRRSSASTVRFHVGPALLFQPTSPGLFTALDIGRRAVGARLSGSWLRAESDQGLSVYTAELWIDFRDRYQLHPILGAGASWLHGGAVGDDGNAGAGVLRGTVEYELPIEHADARLGLSLLVLVPAIGTERTRPWATTALSLAAGF